MNVEIKHHWNKLTSGNISSEEKEILLKNIFAIALSIIKLKINKNGYFSLPFINIKDMAIESTVFLFTSQDSKKVRIVRYVEEFRTNNQEKYDFDFCFYKAVNKAVDRVLNFNLLKWDLINVSDLNNIPPD